MEFSAVGPVEKVGESREAKDIGGKSSGGAGRSYADLGEELPSHSNTKHHHGGRDQVRERC